MLIAARFRGSGDGPRGDFLGGTADMPGKDGSMGRWNLDGRDRLERGREGAGIAGNGKTRANLRYLSGNPASRLARGNGGAKTTKATAVRTGIPLAAELAWDLIAD